MAPLAVGVFAQSARRLLWPSILHPEMIGAVLEKLVLLAGPVGVERGGETQVNLLEASGERVPDGVRRAGRIARYDAAMILGAAGFPDALREAQGGAEITCVERDYNGHKRKALSYHRRFHCSRF